MSVPVIFDSEYRFCLILWEHEPITCSKLAQLCKEKLAWSRTTTYTVIKRLFDRGVLKKTGSMVSSVVSKEEAQISELEQLMEKKFEGSIPAFIAAFSKSKKITDKEVDMLRKMIEGAGK